MVTSDRHTYVRDVKQNVPHLLCSGIAFLVLHADSLYIQPKIASYRLHENLFKPFCTDIHGSPYGKYQKRLHFWATCNIARRLVSLVTLAHNADGITLMATRAVRLNLDIVFEPHNLQYFLRHIHR